MKKNIFHLVVFCQQIRRSGFDCRLYFEFSTLLSFYLSLYLDLLYTIEFRYLKVKVHSKLLTSQSKVSGPRKIYFELEKFETKRYRVKVPHSLIAVGAVGV